MKRIFRFIATAEEQPDRHRPGHEQRGVDQRVLDRLRHHRIVRQLAGSWPCPRTACWA